MVNPKQVRIGNYLFDKDWDAARPIGATDIYNMVVKGSENFEPIELTTEWLEKRLGFEKGYCDEMEGYMQTFGGRVTFFLVEQPYTNGASGFLSFIETNVGMGINSICLNPPECVHQLMNLVYDFTGEELTIKAI